MWQLVRYPQTKQSINVIGLTCTTHHVLCRLMSDHDKWLREMSHFLWLSFDCSSMVVLVACLYDSNYLSFYSPQVNLNTSQRSQCHDPALWLMTICIKVLPQHPQVFHVHMSLDASQVTLTPSKWQQITRSVWSAICHPHLPDFWTWLKFKCTITL